MMMMMIIIIIIMVTIIKLYHDRSMITDQLFITTDRSYLYLKNY